jgi:hypothetical protein
VSRGGGHLTGLVPGQDPLQAVGAHALMLSRVSTYVGQLPWV